MKHATLIHLVVAGVVSVLSAVAACNNKQGQQTIETTESSELVTFFCKQYRCRPNPKMQKHCFTKGEPTCEEKIFGLKLCKWHEIEKKCTPDDSCIKYTDESDCMDKTNNLCWWKQGSGLTTWNCNRFRCRRYTLGSLDEHCYWQTNRPACVLVKNKNNETACTWDSTQKTCTASEQNLDKENDFCEDLSENDCRSKPRLCKWLDSEELTSEG